MKLPNGKVGTVAAGAFTTFLFCAESAEAEENWQPDYAGATITAIDGFAEEFGDKGLSKFAKGLGPVVSGASAVNNFNQGNVPEALGDLTRAGVSLVSFGGGPVGVGAGVVAQEVLATKVTNAARKVDQIFNNKAAQFKRRLRKAGLRQEDISSYHDVGYDRTSQVQYYHDFFRELHKREATKAAEKGLPYEPPEDEVEVIREMQNILQPPNASVREDVSTCPPEALAEFNARVADLFTNAPPDNGFYDSKDVFFLDRYRETYGDNKKTRERGYKELSRPEDFSTKGAKALVDLSEFTMRAQVEKHSDRVSY
ncbi:MAG: hypothetical protein AAFR02_06410, partial [Pseudomonadota bacterium]